MEIKQPPYRQAPEVIARYQVGSEWWVAMPEAKPQVRARVKPGKGETTVVVFKSGEIEHDDTVVIDTTFKPAASKPWRKKEKDEHVQADS